MNGSPPASSFFTDSFPRPSLTSETPPPPLPDFGPPSRMPRGPPPPPPPPPPPSPLNRTPLASRAAKKVLVKILSLQVEIEKTLNIDLWLRVMDSSRKERCETHSFEMSGYRKFPTINWTFDSTIESVSRTLLRDIKRRKPSYFSHIVRAENLCLHIMYSDSSTWGQ